MTGHRLKPESGQVHGTCVAIGGLGVLILGPPGSGKSDLALRLIDQPGFGTSGKLQSAQLVADDQVLLRREGERIIATAPAAIAGKLEIRGLGIVELPVAANVPLCLVVRLVAAADIERMPESADRQQEILGIVVPRADIDPRLPSAPARLRAALDGLKAS